MLKSAFRATGWDINRPSALLALIKLTLPSCRVETRSPLGAPVFPFQHQANAPEDRPQQEKLNAEHALPYAVAWLEHKCTSVDGVLVPAFAGRRLRRHLGEPKAVNYRYSLLTLRGWHHLRRQKGPFYGLGK